MRALGPDTDRVRRWWLGCWPSLMTERQWPDEVRSLVEQLVWRHLSPVPGSNPAPAWVSVSVEFRPMCHNDVVVCTVYTLETYFFIFLPYCLCLCPVYILSFCFRLYYPPPVSYYQRWVLFSNVGMSVRLWICRSRAVFKGRGYGFKPPKLWRKYLIGPSVSLFTVTPTTMQRWAALVNCLLLILLAYRKL